MEELNQRLETEIQSLKEEKQELEVRVSETEAEVDRLTAALELQKRIYREKLDDIRELDKVYNKSLGEKNQRIAELRKELDSLLLKRQKLKKDS